MHADDLEELIGRKLRSLPEPLAPPTLWPRVRAAVEEHLARPWYRRTWRDWPLALRAASLALAAGVLVGWPLAGSAGLWSPAPGLVRSVGASVGGGAGALVTAVDALRHALVEPLAVYVVAFALVTGTAAAALGIALKQALTLGGFSRS